jgi:H+/Cl- antiporter ClcA
MLSMLGNEKKSQPYNKISGEESFLSLYCLLLWFHLIMFLTECVACVVAVAQLHLDALSIFHGQTRSDRQVEFLAATVEDLSPAAFSFPHYYVLALVCALVGRLPTATHKRTRTFSQHVVIENQTRLK